MSLPVGEIMNPSPVTTASHATLATAAAAMRGRDVGSAVVVDDGRVVGILTERDVARAVAAGAVPTQATVDAWMTSAPITARRDDDFAAALDRMLGRHVRHLPVCDDGHLAGMLSLRQLVRAASERHADPWAASSARGLADIVVAETRLSHVDGAAGRLLYVGHDAVALARRRRLEDVWHLLHRGTLPDDDAFAATLTGLRASPLSPARLTAIASAGGPFMSRLQAAIAAAGGALGLTPWHERDPDAVADEALHVAAIVPTLVCALWRLEHGESPVAPDPTLGHAANMLWMLTGRAPDPAAVQALERYLVLTAEHGMNASTFTARVVASTGADVGSAVAAAAGALSGPLHGGAPSLVLDMLDEVETPERAVAWVDAALAQGRRLMGFGHRVYRTEDPRAACLRDTAMALSSPRVQVALAVETAALARLRAAKPDRVLATNVEFWSALALERAGIPRPLFTATFTVARAAGWTAHVVEQVRDNRLIRPQSAYVGPAERPVD